MSVLAITLLWTTGAVAQHQLILGPHAHQVLESPSFAGFQTYYRETGTTQCVEKKEATLVLTGGIRPITSIPLTLSITVPGSYTWDAAQGFVDKQGDRGDAYRVGDDDLTLGLHYRLDFTSLQQRWRATGNYVLFTAGVELPSGQVDHISYSGSTDFVFGSQFGLEWDALAATAYGFYRLTGSDARTSYGDNVLAGLSIAYTPWDDLVEQMRLSVHLGLGFEFSHSDTIDGAPVTLNDEGDELTGGWGLFIHPMVSYHLNANIRLMALGAIPVAQSYENIALIERFRVGLGILYVFGP
jgi:hypothetical protein